MNPRRKPSLPPNQLRARAEKLLAKTPREVAAMPVDDVQKLVHELQVHQIELEMQNDELRRTQLELEAARERLLLPYDAAPVGFLTLDANGVIREANLAAARLLNFDRVKLTGQKLTRFIAPESQDDFYLHRQQLFSTGGKQTYELHLLPADRSAMIVRVEAVVERGDAGRPPRCLAMMSDITGQKLAEARLATFAEATFEGITESEGGRITDCNEQYARLLSCTVAEAKGLEIAATIAPEDRERVMANIQEGRESVLEHVFLRRDGTRLIVEAHGRNLPGSARRHSALRDITARKQAEERLRRLNRSLQVLGRSGRALLHATAEAAYLEEVCRIVVEDCGHAMVWVGFAEPDAAKSVRPVASAGFEQGYLDTLQLSWADTERGRGPTGTAIRTGQVCQCRDMHTDPQFAPWRDEAIKRGYGSSAVFPLLADGRAFGALTIYSPQAEGLDEEELRLLTELAGDLAHGISTLRLREALREREEQLRLFVDHAPAAIAMLDTQMRYVAASQRWLADYGFSGQDILGRSHYELFPEIPERWKEIHRRCLAGAVERADEDQFIRSDGSAQWICWEIQPWKTASGTIGGIIIFSEDITARKQAEDSLQASMAELLRFNRAAVGRELRMVELKREINALRAAAGQPPQFDLKFATEENPALAAKLPGHE